MHAYGAVQAKPPHETKRNSNHMTCRASTHTVSENAIFYSSSWQGSVMCCQASCTGGHSVIKLKKPLPVLPREFIDCEPIKVKPLTASGLSHVPLGESNTIEPCPF